MPDEGVQARDVEVELFIGVIELCAWWSVHGDDGMVL